MLIKNDNFFSVADTLRLYFHLNIIEHILYFLNRQ